MKVDRQGNDVLDDAPIGIEPWKTALLQKTGSWILDPGSWSLDPGSWILDPDIFVRKSLKADRFSLEIWILDPWKVVFLPIPIGFILTIHCIDPMQRINL